MCARACMCVGDGERGLVVFSISGASGRTGVEGHTMGDSVTACCKSNNAGVLLPFSDDRQLLNNPASHLPLVA